MKKQNENKWKNRFNFTLIELLVVMSMIIVLAALLVPLLKEVRREMDKTSCTNNLKEISGLLYMYTSDHGGFLPAAYRNGDGNYWSNILYSLYVVENLEYLGISASPWDTPNSKQYTDWIGYGGLGCLNETETYPFHCPSQTDSWNGSKWRGNPVSYAMNVYGGSRNDRGTPARLNSLKSPSEKMLVMGSGLIPYFYSSAYHYKDYMECRMMTIHGDERNVLYVDGRVSSIEGMEVPLLNSDPFWDGE